MKNSILHQLCAITLTLFVFSGQSPACNKGENARKQLDLLLAAIVKNDYNAFVKNGTDNFKEDMTREMMTDLSGHLSPPMKKGYTTTFFGELTQQKYKVHVWKISFMDKHDDILAKLVLGDGKVAGFFLE